MKKLLLWAVAASLLVAAVVAAASALQTPTYEASALVVVGQKEQSDGKIHPIPNYRPLGLGGRRVVAIATDIRPVAEEAIQRLELGISPYELLNNLTIEPVEHTQSVRLVYTDTDPVRAKEIVNAVGQVSSERISEADATANSITANAWKKAIVPDTPASPKPLRNGLIALAAALAISSAALFVVRRGWLRLGGTSE